MSSLLSRLLCAFLGNCETITKLVVEDILEVLCHLLLMDSLGPDGVGELISAQHNYERSFGKARGKRSTPFGEHDKAGPRRRGKHGSH